MSERKIDIPNLSFKELTGQAPLNRDPIDKTVVEAFDAHYPDESDEQIYARIVRACRSAGNPDAEIPMTVETVTRLRAEVAS